MSDDSHPEKPHASATLAERRGVRLSGALLLVGLVANVIQRALLQPTGEGRRSGAVFTEYAMSDVWIATRLAEFTLVLVALAGLLVLCGVLRRETPYLALLAAGGIIASGGTWTVLQAVDCVTLQREVDAWVAAEETEKSDRYADAETTRWIEWGLHAHFQVLLGVAFLLLGAAIVLSRPVSSGLGVLLMVGGLLSVAKGIAIDYQGLESGFQGGVDIVLQLVVLVVGIGLLAVGRRRVLPRVVPTPGPGGGPGRGGGAV